MEIIILHPHLLYPGGASKYMLEVASRLHKKGYKVTVVLTRYNKELTKDYRNIKFVEIGGPTTGQILFWITLPLFLYRMKIILDRYDHKILFPQVFPPVWWAALYKITSPQTKIVWMCQEPSAFIHSPLVIRSLKQPGKTIAIILNPVLKIIDTLLVKNIDYIIANSLYGKNLIKNAYNREADIHAYPSVDPRIFKPKSTKENYIFTVSRLDKQKNIDLVIRAFSLLPDELKKRYELVIGGEGVEAKNLMSFARALGVKTRIKFLGRVSNDKLPRLYSEAKIVVFLGENEPFGIIPVEAMSSGTPVIGLNSGGVKESIKNGKTGILLGNKNPENLANRMGKLLRDEKALKIMSRNARRHVELNFSWDLTTDKIDKLLKKIK